MPGYEERASILQDEGAMIFKMVCDRATPKQWAEWLRAPLEHAAGTGNVVLMDKLLRAGADGSAGWKGCDGKSLLHAAAEGGNERVVTTLMRAGAKEDMDRKTHAKGRTPLHLAAFGGKVAVAKVLILVGADVNSLDADGKSPLHLAIRGGHAGVAEDLLLCGAGPDPKASFSFLLYLAAGRGQDGVVRSLLHKGVLVNRLSAGSGRTPLYQAVRKGHLSTVKVLLDGGADTTILCEGFSALTSAAHNNKVDILAALVEAGADIEAKNTNGSTPLHASAYVDSHVAMLALLRLGANVHATFPMSGETPLHFACQEGKLDAAGLLLRWGADETALDKKARTPSARIPSIAKVAEQDRPRLERLSKLLACAPQDRAWRRRGMLILCRAHPNRLRLAIEIPDTAELSGQPQGRPTRRARREQVGVEVTIGDARNGEARSSAGGGRRASREGSGGGGGGGGGFDGVAAWLMALTNEDVFRKIVGFL